MSNFIDLMDEDAVKNYKYIPEFTESDITAFNEKKEAIEKYKKHFNKEFPFECVVDMFEIAKFVKHAINENKSIEELYPRMYWPMEKFELHTE